MLYQLSHLPRPESRQILIRLDFNQLGLVGSCSLFWKNKSLGTKGREGEKEGKRKGWKGKREGKGGKGKGKEIPGGL